MSQPVVRVEKVEKSFERVKAVDGISFAVRPGEIFALLGPNGAGKSTLVRMMVGILRPDAGEIVYGIGGPGRMPGTPGPADLGYLPEDRGLYKDIPILRTLAYFGVLRGMDRRSAERAARTWLERLGLSERAGDRLETLSKGNQQKVQLASAILHRPRFALLDEPFSGLDPLNQEVLLGLLRELRDEGMTVLLSAHQMELIERVADRVLLMGQGREVLSGTIREILGAAPASRKIWVTVRDRPDALAIEPRDGDRLSDLLAAVEREHEIVEIRTERQSLHDVYIRALGGAAPDEPPAQPAQDTEEPA